MLVRNYTKDAVAGHPDLDFIIVDEPDARSGGLRGVRELGKKIRAFNFDTAIVLHPTFRLALSAWLAKIPRRVGTGYRFYSFLFTHKVYHHRKKSQKHECDLNLELAQAVGAKIENIKFKFFVPGDSHEKISKLLAQANILKEEKFVVLHPGSGGSALDWPLDCFGELGNRLVSDGFPVILTGSKAENKIVDRVISVNKNMIRMDGQLSIKDLAALLQKASVVVANSTGPLHLAVALGTRVIGLYAPILACLPERWGPYRQTDSVFVPKVEMCRRCSPKNCREKDCMRLITVDEVYNKVVEKLRTIK